MILDVELTLRATVLVRQIVADLLILLVHVTLYREVGLIFKCRIGAAFRYQITQRVHDHRFFLIQEELKLSS